MKITVYNNYKKLSQAAASFIIKLIKQKPNLLMCVATGSTPTLTYKLLAQKYQRNPKLFAQIRILKLDEWAGVPLDDPSTCESYIKKEIIRPLKISPSRFISFDNKTKYLKQEVKKLEKKLQKLGKIDLCILGLGLNGHLGLNEPAENLSFGPHIVKLTTKTKTHSMIKGKEGKISYGLTLGMGNIMTAKNILFLVNGKKKQQIFKKVLKKEISTYLPASLLWLHPQVKCLVDKEVIRKK